MNIQRLGCVALALMVVGCTPSADPNRPKTYPVNGVVTYKGQPVEGATVMFLASGSGGRGAVGTTDASGKFTLTTFEAADGALPGSYKATVTKTEMNEVAVDVGSSGTSPTEEPPSSTAKDVLPKKYTDANTSGLTADVKESGDNNVTFDLTD